MKKATLKKLNAYRLSVEEKKSIKGGYNEATYPDDGPDDKDSPKCLMGTVPVWYGCSYGGGTTCVPCSEGNKYYEYSHPNCMNTTSEPSAGFME